MDTSSNETFSSWLEKRYKKKNIKGIQPNKLRKYLTTHSGDKYNKRNQCDYTSEHARNLRIHLKTHYGKKDTNAPNVTIPSLSFESSLWWKVIQVQYMQLYILLFKPFKNTLEFSLRRHTFKMQPMRLCIF